MSEASTREERSVDRLRLEVATPKGLVLQVDCDEVEAPSVAGEFGVLPGHLPVLAALKCGPLRYRDGSKVRYAAVGPGFVQGEADRVLLLTERFEEAEAVDMAEAREDLTAAEQRLAAYEEAHEGAAWRALRIEVDWALARIEAAELARTA